MSEGEDQRSTAVAGGDPGASEPNPDKPKIDWEDPTVPIGNAPAMPGWPLVVASLAWAACIVLLLVMMVSRMQSAPS